MALFLGAALAARAAVPAAILDRAAQAAEHEAAALSSVACTETVTEAKVGPKDKVLEQRRRIFDYFAMVDSEDGDLGITESRIEKSAGKHDTQPLLVSTGFATMMLVLHPFYQDSFDFTDLGVVTDHGSEWRRIGFAYRPGKRSPSVLRAGNEEYVLGWSGEVRIEESTGRVGLVHAALSEPLLALGIERLDAEVRYGPVPLPQSPPEWLPLSATIDLRTPHQHWRNVHAFASYKRFEVTTTEKRAGASQ